MSGHIRFFEHFTKQYIYNFFKFADYIELNDNVLDLLFERLEVKNETEFFELLDLELLVITKGKNGAMFLYKSENKVQVISKKPEKVVAPIDTAGAGDAFFSSMLREYAYTKKIDKAFIDKSFKISNEASREVLMQVGSRKC